MNAPVTLPTPTLDELIASTPAYEAITNIAHSRHPNDYSDARWAASGVTQAIEEWAFDVGLPTTVVLKPLKDAAFVHVLRAGIAAREALQQGDLFETRPIADGAARCEARAELAGEQ